MVFFVSAWGCWWFKGSDGVGALAASGPTRLWLFWVYIRFCGCAVWRFRPYGEALFPDAEKVPKKAWPLRSALADSGSFAPGPIRAQRLRFAALHLRPLCLAAPDGRCAPTPGSVPPLSLPMGPAWQDQGHSSFAHCKEWLEAAFGLGSVGWLPLTPALSPRRGSRFVGCSRPEYDSVVQVGGSLVSTSVSSLSLRERARVRGF